MPVGARLGVGELPDPPVGVGLAGSRRARRRGRARRGRRRRAAALGVEDVGRDRRSRRIYLPRSPSTRCSRAISASSALTSRPSRTTSSPPTYSRSTRCGPEKTSPATEILGAAELEPVRAPDRDVGALARLERADVVAAEHARRRRACRAAARRARSAPPAPPRPRATSSACFTSKNRSLRSFDAEPSTPSPTRTPASSSSRTGAMPAPSRRFEVGQCATPTPVSREARDVGVARGGRSARTRRRRRASRALEVLDRRAAVELAAVRLLLDRLGEVRVQLQAEPPRERGRLLHQPRRDRERRARRDRDLTRSPSASAASRSVSARIASSVLDERVGRQAALGLAEVHRAARGDDAHAELARGARPRPRRARASPRGKT